MNKALATIHSRVVALPLDHVDTDQIIPARFLTTTTREGLGAGLFANWRMQKDCPLNDPRAKDARVLVAGDDFGCGSSREHAAWALHDFGFRAVISTSIADIFRANAQTNGIVPIVVDQKTQEHLLAHPWCRVEIDVPSCTLRIHDGPVVRFSLDAFTKTCLTKGVDPLGYLLSHLDEIKAFEETRS